MHLLCQGNALRIPLADQSVHCVVTSPPYWGLRDYGIPGQLGLEPTPEQYITNMVAVFREVKRVLRDDGTCWVNIGDSYASGGRDSYCAPSNREVRHTGFNEVVPPRPDSGLKPKDLVGIPWRLALALQADGWYLRSDIIWAKPNPMPESVTDRPTKSHEYLFLLSKSERYYFDAEAVRQPGLDYGNAESYRKRVGNAQYHEGNADPGGGGLRGKGGFADSYNPAGRNIRSVWTIPTESYAGAHFATFPRKLVEPCVKAGTKLGGVVFDPFIGSGTTIVVANALGRHGIGLDLSAEYLKQAQHRITRPHARPVRPSLVQEVHPLFDREET